MGDFDNKNSAERFSRLSQEEASFLLSIHNGKHVKELTGSCTVHVQRNTYDFLKMF